MWSDTCKIRINQNVPHYRLNGRSTGFCGKKTTDIWTKTEEESSSSLRYRSLGALLHKGAKAPVCKAHANRLRTSRTSADFEVWYMIWTLRQGEAVLEPVKPVEPAPVLVEPAPVPEKGEYRVTVRYGDGEDLVSYEKTWLLALNTLTGWRDDEVGDDFYKHHKEHLENYSSGSLLLEIFRLLEDDLMETPIVGSVRIEFIGEGSGIFPGRSAK